VTVVGGFGAIGTTGFVWRKAYFVQPAGRCWIGVPLYVTALLLVFDVCINTLLTLTFVYLTRPLLTKNLPLTTYPATRFAEWFSHSFSRNARHSIQLQRGNPVAAKQTERLLWKTLIGCVLVVLPTVANLMTMGLLGGIELAWVCLIVCTVDGMDSYN
jgi:hypothetical protein